MKNFGKLLTAMVTPFDEHGCIDFELTKRLVDHLLANGSDGIVVCGTTGESPTLDDQERIQLISCVVKHVNHRAYVVAGTGTNNTKTSAELTKAAEELGVDGIMIVVPYYNKPQQEGLYRHYSTISASTKLPIIIYNVPGRCGLAISKETVVRLATDRTNIVALKHASNDMELVEFVKAHLDDFTIYSGEDGMLLEGLRHGMDGIISVTSHVIGNEIKQCIELFENGVEDEQLDQYLKDVAKLAFSESSPAPIKYMLGRLGFDINRLRLPLIPLSDETKARIDQFFVK